MNPNFKTLSIFLFSLVFSFLSCKKDEERNLNSPGIIENRIGEIASKYSIPKEILLTAAYTQSNFGADSIEVKNELSDSKREFYYGIQRHELPKHITPDSSPDSDPHLTFYQITEYLAEKIKELSEQRKEEDPKWLDLVTEVIVGNVDSDKKPKQHMTLKPMIQNFNDGFTSYQDNEVILLKTNQNPLPNSFHLNNESTILKNNQLTKQIRAHIRYRKYQGQKQKITQ